jgi:hypothetical protein
VISKMMNAGAVTPTSVKVELVTLPVSVILKSWTWVNAGNAGVAEKPTVVEEKNDIGFYGVTVPPLSASALVPSK